MERARTGISSKAQTTMDYLILTAVVLVVIVPLLFLSSERLQSAGESQLTEALQNIKSGILTINNLGYGAATRVVVQIPKGVTQQVVQGGQLTYYVSGGPVFISVPAELLGTLPTTEGRHFVNLFNDGKHIYLYECGNNQIEPPFEQCDGSAANSCALGGPLGSGCYESTSPYGACRCICNNDRECGVGGTCVIPSGSAIGYCAPCQSNEECGAGNICQFGTCVPDPCVAANCNPSTQVCLNGQCFPKPVCGNGQWEQPAEQCEPGVGGCSSTEECTSACTCQSICGNGQINGGETCDPGSVQTNICAAGEACVDCTCQAQQQAYCGDGQVTTPPEVCDETASPNNCNNPGELCVTCSVCIPPPPPCTPGQLCGNGQICSSTGVCVNCNPLSSATACPGNLFCYQGTCSSCGNGQLETQLGEQCEYSAILGQVIGTCPSESPACNTATCTCGGTPLTSPFCGNGVIEAGEVCDEGSNNGVAGTKSNICLIRKSGAVCGLNCKCQAPNNGVYCGNEQLNPPGEGCDPTYSGSCGGGLLCLNSCACSGKPQCGNGVIELGEMCDGTTQGCFFGEGIETACVDCVCTYYTLPPPPPPPPPRCPIPEGVSCTTAAECTAPAQPGTSWECQNNCCVLVQSAFV